MYFDDEKNEMNLEELNEAAAAEMEAMLSDGGDDDIVDEEEEKGNLAKRLAAIYEVPVNVQAVLGKTTMPVNQLLKLGRGAVIELNRKVGEAVDIYVNDRVVARGEIVVVGENLGITLTEIVKTELADTA